LAKLRSLAFIPGTALLVSGDEHGDVTVWNVLHDGGETVKMDNLVLQI
jgi:hypothetical protein